MIYIITCKSAGNRINEVLNKLSMESVSIVDSFDFTWIESWNFLFNISKDFDKSDDCYDLSNGEIGCYLAHMEVFRRFLNTDEKFCSTFEDDLDLPEYWREVYKEALSICEKDNIPYCSLGNFGDFDRNSKRDFVKITGQYTRCTHAHIIHRELVKILYNKRFPICRPFDHFINHILKSMNIHTSLYFNPGFQQRKVKSLLKGNIVKSEYKIFI